jgi:hypothetical protein
MNIPAESPSTTRSRPGYVSATGSLCAHRWEWVGLALAMLLAGGCSALGTPAAPVPDPGTDAQCVVGVEPTMRLVTFSAPGSLAGGVTSVFFRSMPEVAPGDLVRLEQTAGAGPMVRRLEATSPRCTEVTGAAADHHAGHGDEGPETGAKQDAHAHH